MKTSLTERKKELKEKLQTQMLQDAGTAINAGKITHFQQVYDYISRTALARQLGENASSFLLHKAANGDLWRVEDIKRLAALTGAESDRLYKLLEKHHITKEKK